MLKSFCPIFKTFGIRSEPEARRTSACRSLLIAACTQGTIICNAQTRISIDNTQGDVVRLILWFDLGRPWSPNVFPPEAVWVFVVTL